MGCVRRGKKQKQGPKTLTKEEATGVPSTTVRILDRTNWAEVEQRQVVKALPGKMSSLYGAVIGMGAVLALHQHPLRHGQGSSARHQGSG